MQLQPVKANILGAGISADSEDDSVELIRVGRTILILCSHLQLSRGTLFNPLDALRHALTDHVYAVLFHVISNLVCHLLVEASQQDASHHHGSVTAKRSTESS